MAKRLFAGGLAIFLVLPAIPVAAQPAPANAAVEVASKSAGDLELDDQQGWAVAWDEQHPISHSDGARVARLRLFADGRIVGARSSHEALVRRKISERAAAALIADLVAMAGDPEIRADDAVSVSPLGAALWDQYQELVRIVHDGKTYAIHVTHPSAEGDLGSIPLGWKDMNERLWALLHEPMASVSEARAAIEAKLDEKIDVAISPVGLIFALDAIERQGGVKVTVDLARLKEKGVTQNAKIEYSSRGKPLRESFKEILASVGLEFEVTDDGVFIPARAPAGK
jgi:hypothetical protein